MFPCVDQGGVCVCVCVCVGGGWGGDEVHARVVAMFLCADRAVCV